MDRVSQPFTIRFAKPEDVSLILTFITKLAIYEKMLDDVIATEQSLMVSLFDKKEAEVIIGEEHGVPVGFALFFQSYSTFLGKSNLFLEDLFVNEEKRGKGYGKMLLSKLSNIAIKRNCSRLEWLCLNWNQSSIDFYHKLGAKPLDDWTVFRLQGKDLKALSMYENE